MTELGNFYNPQDLREYEDPKPEWLKGRYGMLSDRDILRCLEERIIEITPLPGLKKALNTCKVDFHLGDIIREFKRAQVTYVDLKEDVPPDFYQDFVMGQGRPYLLHEGQTVIGQTKELLTLPPYIAARVEGKSKTARRGLGVQLAALIDAGWKDGKPTLELHNLGVVPIKLEAGDAVGAFSFELLTSPALFPYAEKAESTYKNQDSPRY